MNRKRQFAGILCGLAMLLAGGVAMAQEDNNGPVVPREFRAVWVATVANIDWPSKPGLSTEEQKKEALAILDKCEALNLNAVVLQIRAQADSFYQSDLEPWSYYLTGQQGKAPKPYYDPLEFWIDEAHARGLELHAWFNPYRANHPAMRGEMSPKSIVKTRPDLALKLAQEGYYWLDPAQKDTQDHSAAVVLDVVKRYDLDGIHFDDYFYPYAEYNEGNDFPDDVSWKAYLDSGGTLSRGDWRHKAVNDFIERIYREIKQTKPHVKFGLSPFGIWRPGHPESIRGFDQYEGLYADAKLWLNEGWIDYFTPQLYWPIDRVEQSFTTLLTWWAGENTKNRHLWPGMSIGAAGRPGGTEEAINQIIATREIVQAGPGNVFFSMRTLMGNRGGLSDALIQGPYAKPALVPASPWLSEKKPEAPKATVKKLDDFRLVSWEARGSDAPFVWCVGKKKGGEWTTEILPAQETQLVIDPKAEGQPITEVAIFAVDRTGNEGEKTIVAVE